jgi:hypothetical protein
LCELTCAQTTNCHFENTEMTIEVEFTVPKRFEIKYLRASAAARYWEDADINGVIDADGSLIPLRKGDCWDPTIDLETGAVLDWPKGTTASIHYKVCDQGQYWLQDAECRDVAKYLSDYVPDLLCVGDNGYGDYIILNIDADGLIEGWRTPSIDPEQWDVIQEVGA